MKYKLVNSVITDNYARRLLSERGVDNYDLFVNGDNFDIGSPEQLNNMDKGAQVLLNIIKQPLHKVVLIIDCDVDGYTSSAILLQYLNEICPEINLSYEIHSGKQHGLEDIFEKIENMDMPPDLVILPDAGSNDYIYHAELKAKGIETLILDHHECDHESEDAIVINNKLSPQYKNKELTGAGVTWQFCRYLDQLTGNHFSDKYIDLVALGLISDMASVIDLENRFIIKQGLSCINNFFFQTLIEKQSFSIGEKLTPIGVAFYIAPLINAVIRVGTTEEKEHLFMAFIDGQLIVPSTKRGEKGQKEKMATQVARDCINARNRQNKIKEKVVETLEIKIAKHDLLNNKILFVRLEEDDEFPAVLNGLVAMQLASKYKRPTIVARLNEEGYIRGSIRGLGESELKDFKTFLNESKFFEYCEGHANAAGCSIKNTDLPAFHAYANKTLSNINFNEDFYDVNFICDGRNDLKELVIDLDSIKDTYGQMNSEPLIVVENIKVDKNKDISIIGRNIDTVKLTYNGMTYMFFRATEFIKALQSAPTIFTLTVIGRANVNEYMGTRTPQIMVDNWELSNYDMFQF